MVIPGGGQFPKGGAVNLFSSHPRTLLEELRARLLATTSHTIAAVSDTVSPQTDFTLSAEGSSAMPKAQPGLFGGNRTQTLQCRQGSQAIPPHL